MSLFTAEEIGRFAPECPVDRRAVVAQALSVELPRWGITHPLDIQHFMANIAHECGGWTIGRENMRYKAQRIMAIFGVGKHSARVTWQEALRLAGNARALANRVYGLGNPKKAKELGNTEANDGYDFRGGGDLQLTGKKSYWAAARAIGVDLVRNPDAIVTFPTRVRAACFEWAKRLSYRGKSVGQWAREDNIEMTCRAVNGGYNGLADRKKKLARAKAIWPAEVLVARLSNTKTPEVATPQELPVPEPKPVETPNPEPELSSEPEFSFELVLEIQVKLKQLGYRPGDLDGEYGAETRNAIMAFEADNGLPVTGKPAVALLEPLLHADLKPVSEKRQNRTVEDLSDSRIIKKAEKISWTTRLLQFLGLGALAPGAIEGADQAGKNLDLETVNTVTGQLKTLVSTIGPYWWVVAIGVGIAVFVYARSLRADAEEVKRARLDDERMGKTLS